MIEITSQISDQQARQIVRELVATYGAEWLQEAAGGDAAPLAQEEPQYLMVPARMLPEDSAGKLHVFSNRTRAVLTAREYMARPDSDSCAYVLRVANVLSRECSVNNKSMGGIV